MRSSCYELLVIFAMCGWVWVLGQRNWGCVHACMGGGQRRIQGGGAEMIFTIIIYHIW